MTQQHLAPTMGRGSTSDAQAQDGAGRDEAIVEIRNPTVETGYPPNPSPITPRTINFNNEGFVPTPEERAYILRLREERANKEREGLARNKEKEDEARRKEAERSAKERDADRIRLEAIKLRREELELQEKLLRDTLTAVQEPEGLSHKRKGGNRDEPQAGESSESEVHSRKTRHTAHSSDSDEEVIRTKDRLNRVERIMFGSRRMDHEPVVTKDIETFRPEAGRNFPKMQEYAGKTDPEEHCEKYELLMTGMGHCNVMLCKMFKTEGVEYVR